MTEAQSALSEWQRLFECRARTRFPEKVARALAEPAPYTRMDAVPELATLLQGAVVAAPQIDAATLFGLVELSFETVLTAGVARDFGEYAQFFDSALQLIDVLRRRHHSTTMLRLAAARFEARVGNGNRRRRSLIEEAVAASLDSGEHVAALLTLAKFHIDVSDYRASRRVLTDCRRIVVAGVPAEFVVDVQTTTGISYYYTDPDKARRYFERAVALGQERMSEPRVNQAVASAIHYLGRLAHDRGDQQVALEHYVTAERLSDNYLSGHGFYHQRLAEILVVHGPVEQAHHHLVRAGAVFARAGQVSIAIAVLDGTWMRYHVRLGHIGEAERIAVHGLALSREHIGPRAEMVLLVELLGLRVRQRRWRAAVPLVLRGASLFLRVEAAGGVIGSVRQFGTIWRRLAPMLRSRSARQPVLVSCPCGDDHSGT
jgi:tetratricopeptide (TPR) repeat protein